METTNLVNAVHRAHGALDVEGLDVLPPFLQERDEEVDGHLDVDGELRCGQRDIADRNAEAEDLLQLELDRGPQIVHLFFHVFRMSDQDRKLVRLVQVRSEETRNLTDDRLGGQEAVVLVGKLLDGLLLLILLHVSVLLEFINVQEAETELFGFVTVFLISQDTQLVLRLGDAWQLD